MGKQRLMLIENGGGDGAGGAEVDDSDGGVCVCIEVDDSDGGVCVCIEVDDRDGADGGGGEKVDGGDGDGGGGDGGGGAAAVDDSDGGVGGGVEVDYSGCLGDAPVVMESSVFASRLTVLMKVLALASRPPIATVLMEAEAAEHPAGAPRPPGRMSPAGCSSPLPFYL